MVVKATLAAYNVILGHPLLNDMRAVVFSYYLLMKFPTPQGMGEVWGDQLKARTCYVLSIRRNKSEETLLIAKQIVHN